VYDGLDPMKLGRYCSEEDPSNAAALANAMKDFWDRKAYWRERGKRGKAAVRDYYSIDKTARAYEEIFRSVGETQCSLR